MRHVTASSDLSDAPQTDRHVRPSQADGQTRENKKTNAQVAVHYYFTFHFNPICCGPRASVPRKMCSSSSSVQRTNVCKSIDRFSGWRQQNSLKQSIYVYYCNRKSFSQYCSVCDQSYGCEIKREITNLITTQNSHSSMSNNAQILRTIDRWLTSDEKMKHKQVTVHNNHLHQYRLPLLRVFAALYHFCDRAARYIY